MRGNWGTPLETKKGGKVLSEEAVKEIQEVAARYPEKQAALLTALHIAQRDAGWLPVEVKEEVARLLDISPAHVEGVARFYTMFKNRPTGKYLLQVCTTLSCSLLGAEHIVEYLKRRLNIDVGETTPDNKFSLVTVQCLASCGTAPVMMINDEHYEALTPQKLEALLSSLE